MPQFAELFVAFYRQLPAINLRPMCDVQGGVIGSGKDAGCEWLAGVGFWQNSARTASGVKDLECRVRW